MFIFDQVPSPISTGKQHEMERCILIQRWKHKVERCLSMRCQAYARCVSNASVLATFPVRMLWLLKMSLGTGQTWVKKEVCWSLKGRPQLSALAFLNKVFSEAFPACWFACMKPSRFLPNFRGIRPLPSLYLSLSLSCKKLSMHIYV